MQGYISSIESMGIHDGPGIRCVVFFGGCPLRCKFCHNPEMWTTQESDIYKPNELVEKIIRFKPYLGDNGGVTFSGGEPLNQIEFLEEMIDLCKKNNIHTCLDTSGVGSNYENVLKKVDLVILDIKDYRDKEYEELTGKNIKFYKKFLEDCIRLNKKLWLRQVIVPGMNDSKEYILGLKEYIKDIPNVEKVQLLPYHTMALEKYEKLGIDYPLKGVPAMDKNKCDELERLVNNN